MCVSKLHRTGRIEPSPATHAAAASRAATRHKAGFADTRLP
ncbi:hypothetical protein LC55x_5025 [Lysobacter capsici]|nr:hypothetical protein LC55x_5025 [Lysobacter capsici]